MAIDVDLNPKSPSSPILIEGSTLNPDRPHLCVDELPKPVLREVAPRAKLQRAGSGQALLRFQLDHQQPITL